MSVYIVFFSCAGTGPGSEPAPPAQPVKKAAPKEKKVDMFRYVPPRKQEEAKTDADLVRRQLTQNNSYFTYLCKQHSKLNPDLKGKFIFVNESGIELMRAVTTAADVWVSVPRPTREASGTSDQRSALNGHYNIATATGGPLSYIEHGVNGWLIDVFDGLKNNLTRRPNEQGEEGLRYY